MNHARFIYFWNCKEINFVSAEILKIMVLKEKRRLSNNNYVVIYTDTVIEKPTLEYTTLETKSIVIPVIPQ